MTSAGSHWTVVEDDNGRCWFALENITGISSGIIPATQIDAALKIGAARWLVCPNCGERKLIRSDDYQCIVCRRDPWLDG